ncbi:unnamed protein product [Closterium sp. NIES-53]
MDNACQYALYADVDNSADGSVCLRVRSLGCLPPVSVDLCLSSLGACVSALGACVASGPDMPPAEASLSFMLDSGKSHCLFHNHKTLTPLLAPVPVALADPSSGPAVVHSSTTLPCPMVSSGVLRGLHIPSFTRNLVGVGYLQDRGITVTFVGGGRTAVCTDAATGSVLATFTRESRSGLYVLHTERSPFASSDQLAASCSCWYLAHLTVLWHHRLGHLTLPRLRSMASHSLVSGLPCVFSSLPPSLAPPCTPCVAGRLNATPHSSSLRPAAAPFQNLHLDVWGPTPMLGPERERYFLVVVDDYSRYTTVFPLAKKSEVTSTLIRWLLATQGTRGSRVRCLHSDRGDEFCFGVLAGFYSKQGIRQSWTLPESPQQNGVVERRIGLIMDITHMSMIHARAPHFLWPYALHYAVHQLNLQPRILRPEVSLTSLWTGSPGVGSAFHVWAHAIPCVFLGFPVGSPDNSFYHPPLHQFLDSRDVRFDESVSYYTRYSCRGLLVSPPPLFLAPSLPPAPAPPVPPPPPGPAPSGVSHATPLPSVVRKGYPIQFDTWLDDLQLYLLSDSKDSVSLFDHTSGASPAPPAIGDSATRSQWLIRDAAARLAIRNHLPLAECAHFGQHRTTQALYDAVVARYSSPTTAALGRLLLPYLFPELSAFATVEDLVTHLRTSDNRYCAAVPTDFLDRNQPPMFITLYFIVTRLLDSLRSVRDHFLVLSLGVLLLLEVLRVLRRDCLPGRSLSPCSSCACGLLGTHAFGVELLELEPLRPVAPGPVARRP